MISKLEARFAWHGNLKQIESFSTNFKKNSLKFFFIRARHRLKPFHANFQLKIFRFCQDKHLAWRGGILQKTPNFGNRMFFPQKSRDSKDGGGLSPRLLFPHCYFRDNMQVLVSISDDFCLQSTYWGFLARFHLRKKNILFNSCHTLIYRLAPFVYCACDYVFFHDWFSRLFKENEEPRRWRTGDIDIKTKMNAVPTAKYKNC